MFYWEYGQQVAVRQENWKAIQPKRGSDWELYDLEKDPDELSNHYGREGYEEPFRRLKRELLAQMKSFEEPALAEGKLRFE